MRRYLRTIGVAALGAAAVVTVVAVLQVGQASGAKVDGPLHSILLGENEIPPGDPDGRGAAGVIVHRGEQLCIGYTVTGLDTPTAAHIHQGKQSENGPVVITLPTPTTGDPGTASGCVTAPADLLAEILDKPSDFYVNVHTGAFPGGAIRGQLVRQTH